MGGSSRKLYLGSSFLVLVGYMIKKGFLQPLSSSKCVLLYIDEGCDPVNKLYYCDMSALRNGLEGLRERCLLFEKKLQIRNLKSGSLVHQLPIDTGSVYGISARREDSTVFIGFTSFVTPGVIYQCNLHNEIPDMKVFHEITVPGFDHADFHVDQVFIPSKDGTETAMFVAAGTNILLDGSHPCFLYGYGGFNTSLMPSFSRPDLFGCALAHVGVMDMLRFHKFTIGHAWTSDYGCSDKEEEFCWLIKYSPLHNVRRPWEQHPSQSHQYAPTMQLTADHADRVVPLHSLKLLEIDEAADRYSFMAKMLGASWIEQIFMRWSVWNFGYLILLFSIVQAIFFLSFC